MALAAGPERQVGKLVIRNIGLLLSGKLEAPVLDADTVVAEAGRITAVGPEKACDTGGARVVIDAKGCALAPGLIDSHVHPVLGDWTPRQSQLGWIESCMNGGVTTMISAGEVHTPGRPRDVIGVKALAITAQRAYENFRPAGVKLLAGAPVLEQGMEEADFADLARSGVKLLGEVGLGTVKAGERSPQDGRLGAQIRHPEHHPHRRPERAGLGLYRRGYGAGGGRRHHRPHQRRTYRPARDADPLPVRALRTRHRDRP